MSGFGNPPVAVPLPLGRHTLVLAQVAVGQPVTDHLEREEVLPLLAQHPTQALHVGLEELAVPRRRAFRVHEALALEKPDFGDGDVGELLAQQREDVADGEVRARRHSLPATR
jgi:hypothetical protein